ncbi:MAG TPA: DUF2207 domain-containing protein, partial [Acidimicrobiia bacterium]|nr:DUF2207 domain-containing protein [Acidimicrobiia bacterium]
MVVNDDGSLEVTEHLTYFFEGSFTGGFREIPLRAGEEISDVVVSEAGIDYQPGGCTDLGCTSSPPSTYGVVDLGGRIRVVWHYVTGGGERVFDVRYRLSGLTKAADDVVDVYLQIWGDEWETTLDQLTASMQLPGPAGTGDVYIWGHPASVTGSTSLGADGIRPSLVAENVPPGQFVEMRVVFPRELLSSTAGATVIGGNRLADILAEEEAEAARDRRRAGLIRAAVIGLGLLTFLPGLIGVAYIYFRYGREPAVPGYDREYEQEPPTELPPAEVGALLSQGQVDERQFTATLFDLIRKKVVTANPVKIPIESWMGLRSEIVDDLELSYNPSHGVSLTGSEEKVVQIVNRVLDGQPRPLHEFRTGIREDAAANAESYTAFR